MSGFITKYYRFLHLVKKLKNMLFLYSKQLKIKSANMYQNCFESKRFKQKF